MISLKFNMKLISEKRSKYIISSDYMVIAFGTLLKYEESPKMTNGALVVSSLLTILESPS